MGLVKCSGCGKMISERAEVCPECGKQQASAAINNTFIDRNLKKDFYIKEQLVCEGWNNSEDKIHILVDKETGVNYIHYSNNLIPRYDNKGNIYIEGSAQKWQQ